MNRHWTVRLRDVAAIERDGIAPSDILAGTAYVGLEHISSGGDELSSAAVDAGELGSSKFRFTGDHILYGKLRPYLAKIAAPDFSGVCSTDILPIRPGPEIDKRFLLHYLRLPENVAWAAGRATGVNLPRLSPSELADLSIPLPPLDEQRRIAAILDKADALRQKRKRAIALLDTLTQSIFLEMFGSPKRDTERWPMVPFDATCVDETSMSEKLQRSEYRLSGRFPVVDQGQAFIGGWTDQDMVCRSALPVVVFGDHTRIVKYVDQPFVVGADGAKVLKPTMRFDVLFLSWLLRLMPLPDLGYSRHMREIKRMSFWAPPIDVQREFADKARQIEARASLFGAQVDLLEDTLASLQHRAFSGQL